MVKYRPIRGTLKESIAEEKIFSSVNEMLKYIELQTGGTVSTEDLSISYTYCKDNRIPWKETRCVCTKRFGNTTYETPQCIGMCCIVNN